METNVLRRFIDDTTAKGAGAALENIGNRPEGIEALAKHPWIPELLAKIETAVRYGQKKVFLVEILKRSGYDLTVQAAPFDPRRLLDPFGELHRQLVLAGCKVAFEDVWRTTRGPCLMYEQLGWKMYLHLR